MRAAPIQVASSILQHGPGPDYLDYIYRRSDRPALRPATLLHGKVVHLPDCFMVVNDPNASLASDVPTAARPVCEHGFVCSVSTPG